MDVELDFRERGSILSDYFSSWLSALQEPACPCAYPRFRAIVAIDCQDYRGVWFCVETEALIGLLRSLFEIATDGGPEGSGQEIWVCKKCGSSYAYLWQEFSINVSCQSLKPLNVAAKNLGPAPITPTPLYGGIVGHTNPPKAHFVPADFEEFRAYFEARSE